jgi:hypothetical protein
MRNVKKNNLLMVLLLMLSLPVFSQTFKSIDQAKAFFEKLDNIHNTAMVTKDSSFFADYYSDKFINCTRSGEINDKEEEIKSLLNMALTKVERVAPQYDVFTYTDDLSSFSVVKKLSWKNSPTTYVRRTIVFQRINNKWKAVSGQGTYVLPKYVE